VCARVARPAWSSGPSTSPLGAKSCARFVSRCYLEDSYCRLRSHMRSRPSPTMPFKAQTGGHSWPQRRPLASFLAPSAPPALFWHYDRFPPERLSYRTALAIALIYFTVCFLTNLIPIHTTVILDGHPLNPGFYVGIAALLLLMCGVVPYLIAFFVRSRLGRGA